jgi:hypothetical protein
MSNCYHQTIWSKIEKEADEPFVSPFDKFPYVYSQVLFLKIYSAQKFTPNLKFVNSSSCINCNPHSDFPFKIKPDISVYCQDSDPNVIMDSTSVEIFIKFKWQSKDDLFGAVHDVE